MGAEEFVPRTRSLRTLATAAQSCRGCDLYKNATQAVFGEGPADARVVMIGEQPGDVEDREGEPFVGPAGRLLDRALAEAGLRREEIYLTNAVKHFKFTRRGGGQRRIHDKPDRGEVLACHPWLTAELAVVQPQIIVLLGATAAQALLGAAFRITRERGRLIESGDRRYFATAHPSAVLRSRNRDEDYAALVRDLSGVAALLSR